MKYLAVLLSLGLTAALAAGCVSSEPLKFESAVHRWVPLGTTVAQAEKTMKHHGFECHLINADNPLNATSGAYLDCERFQVMFHDWSTRLLVTDGKISGYGESTVE